MKKIKTYPNHLEIITSVFIPYKDFDLEDFLDVPTVTRHYECSSIENGRPNARTPQKGHVNEDAVEFKKDNGSIHRFHIRIDGTNNH